MTEALPGLFYLLARLRCWMACPNCLPPQRKAGRGFLAGTAHRPPAVPAAGAHPTDRGA